MILTYTPRLLSFLDNYYSIGTASQSQKTVGKGDNIALGALGFRSSWSSSSVDKGSGSK